jgi:hypothetical protein
MISPGRACACVKKTDKFDEKWKEKKAYAFGGGQENMNLVEFRPENP